MIKKQIYNLFKRLNLDNPLEFARQILAPLCKEKLDLHITNCQECKGCKLKNYQKSKTIGNPDANILIINSNATDSKDVNDYLLNMIDTAGLSLDEVFIINSVNCVLKREFNDESIIRLPNIEEVQNCKYFVDYAIQFVRPRVIIIMGATSLSMYYTEKTFNEVKSDFININGIKTMVTNSASDLSNMLEYHSEEEVLTIANKTLNDIIKVKEYVDNLS